MRNMIPIVVVAVTALLFMAAAPCYGSIASSADVTNVAPAIMSVTTYSNYTNCTNNTPSSAFGPDETVYIQVNVSDANEHFDITDNGYVKVKIVLFNGTDESDFTRFGTNYSLSATLESGHDIYATYKAQFTMLSNDSTRFGDISPTGYYRIKASVSDGTNVTTSNISSPQNADYTYVNATPLVIVSAFEGSTTNTSAVDTHNITNLVLEKTNYGKINFTSVINFTHTIDLSSVVNISDNFISVDSLTLPELAKPAVLSFYNLTFSDPIILRDGLICSSICTRISYAGGVLVFNVTGFSNYSAAEAYCGDSSCNGGENCFTCSGDCGFCYFGSTSSSGGFVLSNITKQLPVENITKKVSTPPAKSAVASSVAPPPPAEPAAEVPAVVCGNGACESAEDCDACPQDCGTCPVPATGAATIVTPLSVNLAVISVLFALGLYGIYRREKHLHRK